MQLRSALLPESCIVHEDDDLIIVDKPVCVPSQSATQGGTDDLTSRVRALLHARDGQDPYLGTHQRLDQATSGLLLFTKRPQVNAHIAAQFEGRKVRKLYLAAIRGGRKPPASLIHHLRKAHDGRMEVVSPKIHGAQNAETSVRVVANKGNRSLLELELHTGRMHQARVQLAHIGTPIVGCDLYGGEAYPRLLLHASTLTIRHPRTDVETTFTAPEPEEFKAYLEGRFEGIPAQADAVVYDTPKLLEARLAAALSRRFALLFPADGVSRSDAFRLINEAGDGFPRLAVDVYGDAAVVQLYGEDEIWADLARRDRVYDALNALGLSELYLKVRPRQANVLVDTRTEKTAPKEPVRGVKADSEIAHTRTAIEYGVGYPVRLDDGLSTGIFLDQRENRRLIASLSKGKRVLNLFAYACGFTIAAAAAGARETVSVDAALGTLERGRDAVLSLAGIDQAAHRFLAEDVFDWLKLAAKRGDRFDVIVLDPPSYSNTKRHRFVTDSDYSQLAADVLALLAPGGHLLACSNHRKTTPQRFWRFMKQASELGKVPYSKLKELPEPIDFPYENSGFCHLKALLATRT